MSWFPDWTEQNCLACWHKTTDPQRDPPVELPGRPRRTTAGASSVARPDERAAYADSTEWPTPRATADSSHYRDPAGIVSNILTITMATYVV